MPDIVQSRHSRRHHRLDRAGFKAPEKMEVTGQLDTGQRKLDDILDQLRGNSSG